MDTPVDWPLGPALKQARERKRLSQRAAARAAGISEGRWRQLEVGYQKNKGVLIAIGTSPTTVRAVAKAVDLDADDALRLAGFTPADFPEEKNEPPTRTDLKTVPIDDLLAEIRRRVVGGVNGHSPSPSEVLGPIGQFGDQPQTRNRSSG